MLDVIICANFGVEKLMGLGNTMGQILEFPIEMAGHLYNRAGTTAQPVMLFGCSFWYLVLLVGQSASRKCCCSIFTKIWLCRN